MSQLVPLVTDQTPMGLSPNFGVPASRVVNQNGDYAFVGEGNTAVFFLSHNASSGTRPTLVLQYGNEFPGFACNPTGFPGSRITSLANVQLNDNGLIAFQAAGDLANGQFFSIILSYNGTCFQDLVDSSMVAPGTGGAAYSNPSLLGLDNAGDFAFLANFSNGQDVFIAMSGRSPTLVAAAGQAAPGTSGKFASFIQGTHISTLMPPSFNNSGQLLLGANITGGAGGTGLFVFSTAGTRKVVANGDANPQGGLFTISSGTPSPNAAWAVFNNQGQVAFIAGGPVGTPAGNSVWINSPTSATTGTTALVAASGSHPPASLGGGTGTMSFAQPSANSNTYGWLGMDDNGDIVALATLSGNTATGQALLRFVATPANSTTYTTQVVAYANEAAPGVANEVFSYIENASINNNGLVAFDSELGNSGQSGPGTVVGGIFEQPAGGAISAIALNGQAVAGLSGGGNFLMFFEDQSKGLFDQVFETVTLNNGTIFFACDVTGGMPLPGAAPAYHGEFSSSGGALRILMNTGQTLVGANIAMTVPSGAGNYVAYEARFAGGLANLVVHNIVTQTTVTVANEGEAATGTPATILSINSFYVNSVGHAAFSVSLTGGGTGHGGVFVAIPGSGISKIAVAGDIDPATGDTIFGPTLPSSTAGEASPFNNNDQVAFTAQVAVFDEIFVGAPGVTPVKVAATGDAGLGGLVLLEQANIALNNSGQLAFLNVPPGTLTVTGGGTTLTNEGVFIATPTGSTPAYSLALVVSTGNSAPSGGTFGILGYPSFNNLGTLAIDATISGGSSRFRQPR